MRQMFFIRTEAEQDRQVSDYQLISMADTGTKRHEAIQEVLEKMKDLGYDWEYVDVAKYVKDKQEAGKLKDLVVKGTQGAETHLIDKRLKLSFRCDGILRRISTDEYYLFEFKNVVSFKFSKLEGRALEQHMQQVICYCNSLDLDKAFVTYENRDVCQLCVPELVEVTDEMKVDMVNYLLECEDYVDRKEAPAKTDDTRNCRYCRYKNICQNYN